MINDEALEAAARASYEIAQQVARALADPVALEAVEAVIGRSWKELSEEQRAHHRRLAHAVITAYDDGTEHDVIPAGVESAITRVAAALADGVDSLTRAMRSGEVRSRQVKAFNRLALSFLDLRAQAVGDWAWLDQRRAEEQEQERQHRHADITRRLIEEWPT